MLTQADKDLITKNSNQVLSEMSTHFAKQVIRRLQSQSDIFIAGGTPSGLVLYAAILGTAIAAGTTLHTLVTENHKVRHFMGEEIIKLFSERAHLVIEMSQEKEDFHGK